MHPGPLQMPSFSGPLRGCRTRPKQKASYRAKGGGELCRAPAQRKKLLRRSITGSTQRENALPHLWAAPPGLVLQQHRFVCSSQLQKLFFLVRQMDTWMQAMTKSDAATLKICNSLVHSFLKYIKKLLSNTLKQALTLIKESSSASTSLKRTLHLLPYSIP